MIKCRFVAIGLLGISLMLWCGCRKKVVPPPPEPEPVAVLEDKNLFVLLADPSGHVGEITVTSARGSQRISRAGYGCEIGHSDRVLERPAAMETKEIMSIFGAALDVQPEPPQHFLLYFRVESAKLDKKSQSVIPEIVQAIQDRNSHDITIIGHADTSGPQDYNCKLSRDRAQNVKDALAAAEVNPDFVEILFRGEKDPLIKTGDNVYEPKNRRVEVVVR
jgi:outer membrane protein OmpA-like peptidoglycan-associated protein